MKENPLCINWASVYDMCGGDYHFLPSQRNLEGVRVHHARLSQSIFMGPANFSTLPSVATHKWARVAERCEGDGRESKATEQGMA